ncbi:MAG TPA: phospholipase D-like domain-containing protein [Ktedonobacteraceae bacterium]|nr:phospholipase D-like domain-containing protein [Ktedonobacteraceae bacterium]
MRKNKSRLLRFHQQHKISHNLIIIVLCTLLAACSANSAINGNGSGGGSMQCQSNCTIGPGVQGVKVFVEPDTGDQFIASAITQAQTSVWVEMYLLTDRAIINALEAAAQRSIDVRVMLEAHPYGASGAMQTLDRLRAAGVKAQTASPDFALTHEKGMILDGTTVYIMTANFTRSALGGTSSVTNREYGIIDTNQPDVQAVQNIFTADWNRTNAQFDDPNLVVSPVNSRNSFTTLINNAHNMLLIEAEEMQDSGIEQALMNAVQRGVKVQVILPTPGNASSDSNSAGITSIQQGGVLVKEDAHLYMHAKIIVADGRTAFVGSENISAASLEHNRELGIIVLDPSVLNTLQQTFQQDWSDSQNV